LCLVVKENDAYGCLGFLKNERVVFAALGLGLTASSHIWEKTERSLEVESVFIQVLAAKPMAQGLLAWCGWRQRRVVFALGMTDEVKYFGSVGSRNERRVGKMKKIFWGALVLSGVMALGALVTAQEIVTQPPMPQMQGMGSMMGMGMKDQGGQMGQSGQMGSMMQMMQGMTQMMDACTRMMGTVSSTGQGGSK